MIHSLTKAFRRLIAPKYDWIDDFYWKHVKYAGSNYYTLIVYVNNSIVVGNTYSQVESILNELEEDTLMLFRMIKFEPDDFFDGVELKNEDDE